MKDQIPEGYELHVDDDVEVAALPRALDALREAARHEGGVLGWAAARPDAKELLGRGLTLHVPAPAGAAAAEGERWVVRHYRRGGAVARINEDRYLDIGTRRPVRELKASHAARERGLPTPQVIGFAFHPTGVWYRADIVTRWVPDSVDLAAVLFPDDPASQPAERGRRAMALTGELVRRAHEAGLVHNDLNLKNVLLQHFDADAGERASGWLLDLDRAAVTRDSVAKFERDLMLRRFARSLKKWEKKRRTKLTHGEREAFAEAYARAATAHEDGSE